MTPTPERRDAARAVLEACVRLLGVGRPEWGRAMLAELAQIEDRHARWGFTFGCVRSIAVRIPPGRSQRAVAAGAIIAAAASAAVVAIALLRFPALVSGVGTWVAVGLFVALLVTYVAAVVNLNARLLDSRLFLTAVLAGVLIAASWMAVGLDASLGGPVVLSVALLGLGPFTALAIGWFATERSRSRGAGVACVGLAALMAGFVLFLLWGGETVATAGRPYDPGLLRDFKTSGASDLATYAVSDSLGAGMMLLLLVPLVSLACGLVGASVADARRRRSRLG